MTTGELAKEPPKWTDRVKARRSEFEASGTDISEWARAKGFDRRLVYQVLSGDRPCVRGKSHQIAVALGLKIDVISVAFNG